MKASAGGEVAFPGNGKLSPEQDELRRLREEHRPLEKKRILPNDRGRQFGNDHSPRVLRKKGSDRVGVGKAIATTTHRWRAFSGR